MFLDCKVYQLASKSLSECQYEVKKKSACRLFFNWFLFPAQKLRSIWCCFCFSKLSKKPISDIKSLLRHVSSSLHSGCRARMFLRRVFVILLPICPFGIAPTSCTRTEFSTKFSLWWTSSRTITSSKSTHAQLWSTMQRLNRRGWVSWIVAAYTFAARADRHIDR